MKNKLIIIGTEGTARNIIEQVSDAVRHYGYNAKIAGLLVDIYPSGYLVAGYPVLGGTADIGRIAEDKTLSFIFGLFKPEKMEERYRMLMNFGISAERFVNFIHPLAYVAESVKMGRGNIIMSNSSVQSDVRMGDFNIINTGVTVEHETILGNGNFIAANACIGSKVKIGNYCFVGLNSAIRENVVLNDNVFTGMQSAVLENFENVIIAGIPARPLKK